MFKRFVDRLSLFPTAAVLAFTFAFASSAMTACTGAPATGEPSVAAPEPPTPEALPAEDYCEVTVDGFCDFYLRCGRMAVDSVEDCRSLFLESCNSKYEQRYRDLVSAGFLELSATGVRSCQEHLQAVACEEQVLDLDGPCRTMWRGQVEGEGACGFDVETFVCGANSACVVGLDLCGTCRPLKSVGDPCDSESTCGPVASCSDGTCVARAVPGESCEETRCSLGAFCEAGVCQGPTYVAQGESCDQRRRCPYGLACISGICEREARQGETCTVAGCATGYCDDVNTCVSPQLDGAACTSSLQCSGGICAQGICTGLPSVCLAGP